jgi:hypothetical protein
VDCAAEALAVVTVDEAGLYRIDQAVLAEAGIEVNADELKIYVGGEEVAAYVTLSHGTMESDDYVVFYVDVGGAQVDVRRGPDPLRMEEIETPPTDEGEVWYGSADTSGVAAFAVDEAHTRYLLVGFTEEPVLVVDVSDTLVPKLLYGYAVLTVKGEIGAYLGYTQPGAECIAVDGQGLRVIGQLQQP